MATPPVNPANLSRDGLRNYLKSQRSLVGDAVDLSDKALSGMTQRELFEIAQQLPALISVAQRQQGVRALAQEAKLTREKLKLADEAWVKSGLTDTESIMSKALAAATKAELEALTGLDVPSAKYIGGQIRAQLGDSADPQTVLTLLAALAATPADQTGLPPGVAPAELARFANAIRSKIASRAKDVEAPPLLARANMLREERQELRERLTALSNEALKAGVDTLGLEAALMPEMMVPATEPTASEAFAGVEDEVVTEPYVGAYIPGTGPAVTIERKDGTLVTIPQSLTSDRDYLRGVISGSIPVTVTRDQIVGATTPAVPETTPEETDTVEQALARFDAAQADEDAFFAEQTPTAREVFSPEVQPAAPEVELAPEILANLPESLPAAPEETFESAAARRPSFWQNEALGDVNKARIEDSVSGLLRAFTDSFLKLEPGADPQFPEREMVPTPESLLKRARRFPVGSADRVMLEQRAASISRALEQNPVVQQIRPTR